MLGTSSGLFVCYSFSLCFSFLFAQRAKCCRNNHRRCQREPPRDQSNIYGVAHATTAQLNDLNSPLNRNGGNNTTRYNWQLNADNRANDWYFESIPEPSAVAGERGDTFDYKCEGGKRSSDANDSDDRLGR